MKNYLTALQNIDREALKAKAEIARSLAGEYARQAKTTAGEYAQHAKSFAEDYAHEAHLRAADALHSPQAEALAESARTLARDVREDAADFCTFTTQRVSTFSPFDFAIFKIMMISFGLWLGAWLASKFTKLTEKFRPVFLAAFFCGFTYIAYRIFFDNRD